MSLVMWAFHHDSHLFNDTKDLRRLKKVVTRIDTDMRKHKPKLEFIDEQVDNAVKREERARKLGCYE